MDKQLGDDHKTDLAQSYSLRGPKDCMQSLNADNADGNSVINSDNNDEIIQLFPRPGCSLKEIKYSDSHVDVRNFVHEPMEISPVASECAAARVLLRNDNTDQQTGQINSEISVMDVCVSNSSVVNKAVSTMCNPSESTSTTECSSAGLVSILELRAVNDRSQQSVVDVPDSDVEVVNVHNMLYANRLMAAKYFLRYEFVDDSLKTRFFGVTSPAGRKPKFTVDYYEGVQQLYKDLRYLCANGVEREIRLLHVLTILEILKNLDPSTFDYSQLDHRLYRITVKLENHASFDVLWVEGFQQKDHFQKSVDLLFVLLNILWERTLMAPNSNASINNSAIMQRRTTVTLNFEFLMSHQNFAFIRRCLDDFAAGPISSDLPRDEFLASLYIKNPNYPNITSFRFRFSGLWY